MSQARTITNPANNSALSSAVVRTQLQDLENEIATLSYMKIETPSGTIDGMNAAFTTSISITLVVALFLNGGFIHPAQYSATGSTITFVSPPDASYSGLPFTVIYV